MKKQCHGRVREETIVGPRITQKYGLLIGPCGHVFHTRLRWLNTMSTSLSWLHNVQNYIKGIPELLVYKGKKIPKWLYSSKREHELLTLERIETDCGQLHFKGCLCHGSLLCNSHLWRHAMLLPTRCVMMQMPAAKETGVVRGEHS